MNIEQALNAADESEEEGLRGIYPTAAQVLAEEVRRLTGRDKPTASIDEKPQYCGACGQWAMGPVTCCFRDEELPYITKAGADAMLKLRHNAALSGAEPALSAERQLEGTVRGENPGDETT